MGVGGGGMGVGEGKARKINSISYEFVQPPHCTKH